MIAPDNMAWEMLYGLGALALLIGLVYAVWRTRGHRPAEHQRREEKTRALYDAPQSEDDEVNKTLARRG